MRTIEKFLEDSDLSIGVVAIIIFLLLTIVVVFMFSRPRKKLSDNYKQEKPTDNRNKADGEGRSGPDRSPTPTPKPKPIERGKDKFDANNTKTRTTELKDDLNFKNFMKDAIQTKKAIVNFTPKSLTANVFGQPNKNRPAVMESPNPFVSLMAQSAGSVRVAPDQYLSLVFPRYPQTFLPTDLTSYVDFVYEPFASGLFQSTTNGDNFKTKIWQTGEGILFDRTKEGLPRRFYRTEYVEVINRSMIYDNTNPDTNRDNFQGTWYDICSGSGYFLPVRQCLLCRNSVHLMNLLGFDDAWFAKTAHSTFKTFVLNEQNRQLLPWKKSDSKPTPEDLNLDRIALAERLSQSPSTDRPKISFMGSIFSGTAVAGSAGNVEDVVVFNKTVQFLVYHAAIRGFRSIQILDEWDESIGAFRNFFCNIIDPALSNRKLEKVHWWSMGRNSSSMDLYNLFLTNFFDDPLQRPFKPDFRSVDPALQKCTEMKGTLSIHDGIRECLKIQAFVDKKTAAEVLFAEDALASIGDLPKNSREDKLRSYWTMVYGHPGVWKDKSLDILERLWKDKEIVFREYAAQLGLSPDDIDGNNRILFYKDPNGCNLYGHCSTKVEVRLFKDRPLELMKFVEVIRSNQRFSHFTDFVPFAATYFYPVNGSGLWLPTGIIAASGSKTNFLQNFQEDPGKEGTWEQDPLLARSAIVHGADTLMVYRFIDHAEIISLKDYISTQASVIRMHPFDERAHQPSDTFFVESNFPIKDTSYSQKDQCFFSFKKFYPSNNVRCSAPAGTF